MVSSFCILILMGLLQKTLRSKGTTANDSMLAE